MMKFRKKPVVVEAVQWNPGRWDNQFTFPDGTVFQICKHRDGPLLRIPTLNGFSYAEPGYWIIKGIHGEFYPCEPNIFKETYERVCVYNKKSIHYEEFKGNRGLICEGCNRKVPETIDGFCIECIYERVHACGATKVFKLGSKVVMEVAIE